MSASQVSLGAVYDDLGCELKITGVSDEVRVGSFEATEALSQPFAYRIVLASTSEAVADLEGALGQEATLTVSRAGQPERVVSGILTEVLPDGAFVGKDQSRTVVLLEPKLVSLRYSGGFRIFQNMSVKDIVTKLLSPEKIEAKWSLRPDAAPREYRTQQDESDLDFLSRLLADEGIHYFFDFGKDETTIVFTNNPLGFAEIDGKSTFDFQETGGAITGEHVRSIRRAQRVRTGAFEHRDYDFTKPALVLKGRSETPSPQNEGNTKRREWRDYPGGFVDPAADGTPRAVMRLQELRSDATTIQGTASTLRLCAGKQFTLAGHSDSAYNKKLLVTKVSFGATVPGAFREHGSGGAKGSRAEAGLAHFQSVLATQPIRPPRRRKPPSRLQTAIVVGPTANDPDVDTFGRIHVQFRWDRDGALDAHSSCAIRMATPMAHDDEGFWSAHRIGSEVLVDFIDGDIDRPVVILALYNGTVLQPYGQPGSVSKSSWKVHSVPYGGGFNEFTFENKSGSEDIVLHAQKDLDEQVNNNHTKNIGNDHANTVGHDQTLEVKNNQTITIDNDQTITVKHDRNLTVNNNHTVTVQANETNSVTQNRTTTISGNESLTVSGTASKTVTGTDTLLIMAGRSLTSPSETLTLGTRTKTVATSETNSIGAGRTSTVGGDESLSISGARQTSVDGNDTLGIGQKYAIAAKEEYILKVGDDASLTLTNGGDIILKTGESTISLAKDGTITLKGKNVSVEASSDANVKGDNVIVKGSSKVAVN